MKRCLGFVCRWIVTSVTSASLLLIMPVTNIAASTEQEKAWWHGTFILAGSGQFGCSDNDSRVTYTDTNAEYWELSCSIQEKTKVRGMDAILLDERCEGMDGDRVPSHVTDVVVR